MCRRILLSLGIPAAAVGAYFLRDQQLYYSLPGDRSTIYLWALLGGVLLLTALLVIPEKEGERLSQLRPIPVAITLQGGGALLLIGSGARQLYELYPMLRSFSAVAAASLILAGIGLFGGMKACEGEKKTAGSLLLFPLAAALLQVINAYFETGAHPALRQYDMQMLFLGAAALSIALLSDFVFFVGQRRTLLLSLSLTVVLAGAAIPSTETLSRLDGIIGTAVAALGFFLSLLFGFDRNDHPQYELVEDPFSTGRVRAAVPHTPSEDPPKDAEPAVDKSSLNPTRSSVASAPSDNDDFDLSRVDRLLTELELEDETRGKRK